MSDEIQQMVDDCMKRDSRLSDWESDFIKSLDDQLSRNLKLTPKQLDKLEIIWDRIT